MLLLVNYLVTAMRKLTDTVKELRGRLQGQPTHHHPHHYPEGKYKTFYPITLGIQQSDGICI